MFQVIYFQAGDQFSRVDLTRDSITWGKHIQPEVLAIHKMSSHENGNLGERKSVKCATATFLECADAALSLWDMLSSGNGV